MQIATRPRRRAVRRLGAGLITALISLTGCASGGSSGGNQAATTMPTVTLAIGSVTALPTLPLQIAINRGLFKKYGVNVKVVNTGSGSKAVDALLAGQADLSGNFYDHVLELAALGKHIQSFVEMTNMPGYALVVTGKGSKTIHSVADLAGKRVGVSSPGSATAFFVSYLLAKAGKSPDSAHFVGIGIGPSAVAAVEHNTVDAAVLYDPDLSQVLSRDPATSVLSDARSPQQAQSLFGASSYPSMTLFSKQSWISSHPTEVEAITKAIVAADQYLHQASASDIMSNLKSAAIGPDRAFYSQILQKTIPYISPDGSLDEAGLQAVLKVQSLANPSVKNATIDLASTYTDKFVSQGA